MKSPSPGIRIPRALPLRAFAVLAVFVVLAPSLGWGDVKFTERGSWPGFIRGSALGVTLSGRYAYLANNNAGLEVVDVIDPSRPTRVGHWSAGSGGASGIVVLGSYAYIAYDAAGLQIVDVIDPTQPTQVGGYDTAGNAGGVAVVGQYAYVADGEAGLQLIDISIPARPTRVGGFNTAEYAYNVAVAGNYGWDFRLRRADSLDELSQWIDLPVASQVNSEFRTSLDAAGDRAYFRLIKR